MLSNLFEKFLSLLDWRLPSPLPKFISQWRVWSIVISYKPLRHLLFQFLEGSECEMVVESLLVGTMTSLNLPIVPWSVGSYELMFDSKFVEEFVYDVDFALPGSFGVGELRTVVGLDYLR